MINSFQTRTAGPALLEDTLTPWLGPLAPWTRHVVVDDDARAHRWIAICTAVSILLHLVLLLIPLAQHMGETPASTSPTQGPLTVRLANPAPRTPPPVEEPHPVPKSHPVPRRPPVIAMRRSASPSKPAFTVPPPPMAPPQPVTLPDQPMDMTAMLEAKRAARRAAEAEAAQENAAAAAAGGPSLNDKIMANINRSKPSKTVGTGGVFQILKIGVREGEFKFNGWHPGSGDHWAETYTVDAGEGGDVRLAVVRKQIEVIRRFYKGDFEFDSRRLGHPVTKSARVADSAELESFLMKEMFEMDDPVRQR